MIRPHPYAFRLVSHFKSSRESHADTFLGAQPNRGFVDGFTSYERSKRLDLSD